MDKLTLAALEATLRGPVTPVRTALEADADELRRRAVKICEALHRHGIAGEVVSSAAAVGGGGAPGVELPSVAVSLPARYATRLRLGEPAVVGRLVRERCLLDLCAVPPEQDALVVEAVRRCG